ncbi:MAG: Calx-beta domain-containing protein [Panacagrimonas sp.]
MKRNSIVLTVNAVALGAASLLVAVPAYAVPEVGTSRNTLLIKECNRSAKVTFQLSETAPGPVTIRYRTRDSSARAGTDFNFRNTTATVRAGSRSTTVAVPLRNDDVFEAREKLLVSILSVSGSGATVAPGLRSRTQVQILDDDAPLGSLTGSLGTGTSQPSAVGGAELFSLTDLFNAAGFANSFDLDGSIDANGRPTCDTAALQRGTFTAPATWPPATATGSTPLPVPSTIVNTSYTGAFNPSQSREQHWDQGWTVAVNGNQDVWRFFGRNIASGTALAGLTTPVANGSCPAGTTVAGTFNGRIGNLANDETVPKLFTGTAAAGDYDICVLPREISANLTLTNDNVYELQDGFPGTYVGNGYRTRNQVANPSTVTLTVQAGTLIFGQPQEALIVSRKSNIVASGRAEAPIVMTSLQQLQQRFDGNIATPVDSGTGEWAGLAIIGFARDANCPGANFATCELPLEGNVGSYGGNDDNDGSGSLNYVVIRHAGNDIDGNGNELNGLTLGGVGRATSIDYVQVHKGFDDGVEFFGGNAFVSHIVVSNTSDDSFDYDTGWTGGAQFVYIVQADTDAPGLGRGIEAGSSPGNVSAPFETFGLLANFTIVGPANRIPGGTIDDRQAVIFRGGVRTQLWNSIATGDQPSGCLDLDDQLTFNRSLEAGGSLTAPGAHLFVRNSIFDCLTTSTVESD